MNTAKLICRKKLGNVLHYGVLLPNGQCYELTPAGPKLSSIEEFAGGQQVTVELEILYTNEVHRRFWELTIGKIKYDLVNFNCEHFARYLLEGQAESKQVNGMLFAVLTILALVVIARS
jgi:hypothetical protein